MSHIFADNIRETTTATGSGDITLEGGTAAIPTAAVGNTLSSVASVGDTFDYVIHHKDVDEWEVGLGTYASSNTFTRTLVLSSSNSDNAVNFSAGTKVFWIGPVASFDQHFAHNVNIETYGAVAGGNNTDIITLARTVAGNNKPIMAGYGNGIWGVKGTTGDFVGDQAGEGTAFSYVQGSDATPSTLSNPLIYLEKTTTSDPTGTHNDHVLDVRVKKTGGTRNTYAIYLAAENTGGTGNASPLSTLMNVTNSSANRAVCHNVFAQRNVVMTDGVLTGMEISIVDNSPADNGWQDTFAFGSTIGINMINNPGRGTFGMRIATGDSGNGFYTGILIDTQSILPDTFDASNRCEAIRVKGGGDSSHRYTGIWFQSGYLRHALNLVGPIYLNNAMMLLPKDDVIIFGTAATDNTAISWKSSGNMFDVANGVISISGTQVVGARSTGWSDPTGTASKSTFSTSGVTTANLAQFVFAMYSALKTHGLLGA